MRRAGTIDLHTHSICSDGTQTPAELVAAAAAAGIAVLGLTDHDTVGGLSAAEDAARMHGVQLLPGMEVSTRNRGQGQHLLVYGLDSHTANTGPLAELVARGMDGRRGRIPAMVEALTTVGAAINVEDVLAAAGTATPGRPHVADALVAAGHATDRADAFDRLLGTGKPGHVVRFAPEIDDVIAAATRVGAVCVVAHPWGRKTHISHDRFVELAAAGLVGIEVDHQEHDTAARAGLREIATDLGLIVTGSSDHHGTGKVNHDLGCNTTAPIELERLLAAAEAARASARRQGQAPGRPGTSR